jgi:hypothetical protein
MTDKHEGGCVCGSLRYVARGDPERVTICHCTWCQRRTGSAFGVEAVFPASAVDLSGDTLLTYRHISDVSGRWLDQQFCSRCGANIGFMAEAVPGIRTIAAGTFDDPSWIEPGRYSFRYVYLRSAQAWSTLPDGVERYEAHFRR